MLNTVINFLFKNFIALWRHLAKTQLLCDAQIYLFSVNKRQQLCFRLVALQRDEIFKRKVNNCVQHIILQKFTNFHGIRSWSFQNICNQIGWPIGPVFLRHSVYRAREKRQDDTGNAAVKGRTNFPQFHSSSLLELTCVARYSVTFMLSGQPAKAPACLAAYISQLTSKIFNMHSITNCHLQLKLSYSTPSETFLNNEKVTTRFEAVRA